MSTKRALVVGLGIAGMSAAVGLKQAGWEPVIVERAASRRTGGYFIGLFPEGKRAADGLGVRSAIHERTATPSATWEVDVDNNRSRSAGFYDQPGHPVGVLRGDIEAGLWEAVDGTVEVRFGTTPQAIVEHGDKVRVTLERDGHRTEEIFDLVVGADGLRSSVRRMVFGPDESFMRSLDSIICAFQLDEQVPQFADRDGLVFAEPGRSLWIFPFEDRPPTALFTYRTTDVDGQFTRPVREVLHEVYDDASTNDAVRHALANVDSTTDHLFDSVHQVHMKTWRQGRVLLLGDAAWCMTLYSGMGATSGMLAGAELGEALRTHDDIEAALAAWEQQMRPFISEHMRIAHLKHQVFVPSNRLVQRLRTLLMRYSGRKLARLGRPSVIPARSGATRRLGSTPAIAVGARS